MDSFRCLIVMLNCLFQIKVYSCFYEKKPKQTRGLDINGFVVHSDHSMCVQQVQVPHTKFFNERYTKSIYFSNYKRSIKQKCFYFSILSYRFYRNILRTNAI